MTKRQWVRSQCSWREIPGPGSHRVGCGRRSRRRSRERLLRGRPGPAGQPGSASGDTASGRERSFRSLGIPSSRDDSSAAGARSELRRPRARARAAEAQRQELHRYRRRHGGGARGSPRAAGASDRVADEDDDRADRDRGRGARPEDQGSEGGDAGRAEQGRAARRPLVSAPAAAQLGALGLVERLRRGARLRGRGRLSEGLPPAHEREGGRAGHGAHDLCERIGTGG